jgi:nucleoredoxin
MPWLTLDFQQRDRKEELSDTYGISGIPTLILLDADSGKVICDDARDQIQNDDKQGENFPWNAKKKKKDKNCILL